MRVALSALILMSAIQAHAIDDFAKYVPSQVGEKVGAISLNVNSGRLGYNCEIGLRNIGALNIETQPGEVVFSNFRKDEEIKASIDLSRTKSFQELLSLTDKIVISNVAEPLHGTAEGFISYDLRTLENDHPDRLAYQGSFFLKMPGFEEPFQHVGGGPYNQRAIQLVNAICNHARMVYNARNRGLEVSSLGADAVNAAATFPNMAVLPVRPLVIKTPPVLTPARKTPATAASGFWARFRARLPF